MDQTRKTALITGATDGIGRHVAASLVAAGYRVWVTGRDEARGSAAAAALGAGALESVRFVRADASLVADSDALVAQLGAEIGESARLDVIVLNAGRVFTHREETAEGIERSLATCFVGPLALLARAQPLLAPVARVVSVVSSAHEMWPHDAFHDVDAHESYAPLLAHGHAKRLNLLATLAFARAHPELRVNAVNPGSAWTPGVAALTVADVPQWRFVWPIVRFFQRRGSPEAAARAVAALALAPQATGTYVDDGRARTLAPRDADVVAQDRALALALARADGARARATEQSQQQAAALRATPPQIAHGTGRSL